MWRNAPEAMKPASSGKTAVMLMLLSSALIAATSLMAKHLGAGDDGTPGLPPFLVSAGRFGFAFLALMLVLTIRPEIRPTFIGATWRWHILRSTFGWLGITCMFTAVAAMPVAEATALSFLSPAIVMVLAVFMLGERLRPRKIVAGVLSALGGALILQPGSDALSTAGLFALAAAVFMAFEMMFIKRLSDSEPALRILVINNAIGATLACFAAAFVWSPPTTPQWLLLACLGAVMVTGQALFIQSVKRAEASAIMPVFYSVLIFAALYDWVLNQVLPTGLVVLGAALILAGAVLLARNGGAPRTNAPGAPHR